MQALKSVVSFSHTSLRRTRTQGHSTSGEGSYQHKRCEKKSNLLVQIQHLLLTLICFLWEGDVQLAKFLFYIVWLSGKFGHIQVISANKRKTRFVWNNSSF